MTDDCGWERSSSEISSLACCEVSREKIWKICEMWHLEKDSQNNSWVQEINVPCRPNQKEFCWCEKKNDRNMWWWHLDEENSKLMESLLMSTIKEMSRFCDFARVLCERVYNWQKRGRGSFSRSPSKTDAIEAELTSFLQVVGSPVKTHQKANDTSLCAISIMGRERDVLRVSVSSPFAQLDEGSLQQHRTNFFGSESTNINKSMPWNPFFVIATTKRTKWNW